MVGATEMASPGQADVGGRPWSETLELTTAMAMTMTPDVSATQVVTICSATDSRLFGLHLEPVAEASKEIDTAAALGDIEWNRFGGRQEDQRRLTVGLCRNDGRDTTNMGDGWYET